jgi:hypothetical protein
MNITKANIEQAVLVEEVPNANPAHKFLGICRKDGWQTHQPTKQLAHDAVVAHAQRFITGV